MNHSQIVSFIWGVADLIRDTFKRGKYQDVILPLTVLRRLDCVLAPGKLKVMEVQARYQDKIENPKGLLQTASGFAFYNTSRYDFAKLLADAPHIAQNLRNYIAGFSPNMREVLEKFDFDNTIAKLDESGLLFQVMQRFGDPKVNLHPDTIDNFTMGTIFEELIRKFNEALNENPGEHFTPAMWSISWSICCWPATRSVCAPRGWCSASAIPAAARAACSPSPRNTSP